MGIAILLAFLAVPLVEIYVIIQVGQVIGAWPTVLLLVLESLIGSWLIKREGRRAWDALRREAGTGRLPGRELADGALVLIGGTLLLTPGFVTDVAGFFFVLPPTRPLARRLLLAWLSRRTARAALRVTRAPRYGPSARPPGSGRGRGRTDERPGPQVVRGEVVDGQDPSAG